MGVSGNALLGTGTAQQHLYSNTPRHSSVQRSSSGGKTHPGKHEEHQLLWRERERDLLEMQGVLH